MHAGNMHAQVNQALDNLETVLQASGWPMTCETNAGSKAANASRKDEQRDVDRP